MMDMDSTSQADSEQNTQNHPTSASPSLPVSPGRENRHESSPIPAIGGTRTHPGFMGKHRMAAVIAYLDQQIQIIQEELDKLESLGQSSTVCQKSKFSWSIGVDTIFKSQPLSGTQTIVSQDGSFELGFFSTGKSNNMYIGIWYKDFAEKTIVWVANREKPISNTSQNSELQISEDGNLVLLSDSRIVWSTNLMLPQPSSVEAVLLDSGNFVLRESSNSSNIFWESFDHPTDTWLPGAKFGYRILGSTLAPQHLISWKSSEDPSPGMFSVVVDTAAGQLLLEWNKSVSYWTTGVWTDQTFRSVPEMSFTTNFSVVPTPNGTYYTYSLYNDLILSRLVIDAFGGLKQFTALRSKRTNWTSTFSQPRDQSDVYAFCGKFGVFSYNLPSSCTCLQGFVPFANENERTNDGTGGCERKSRLQCENSTSPKGKKDGFLRFSNLTLPSNSKAHPVQNFEGCKSACLENCPCTAYSYNGSVCSIWTGALLNLTQVSDEHNNRQDLYVKVAISELQDASGNKKKLAIIAVAVSVVGSVVGGFIFLGTRKIKKRGHGKEEPSQDLLSFDFSSSINTFDNQMKNEKDVRKGNKSGFDLPLFSYAIVSAATNNFSAGHKLGEGGFGPVYKGKSLNGQDIAVKRLSRKSGQGIEEFRNEMLLIPKLQHRNLVRLLGCCIEQDENILIYEYMPNKSLDFFLFDSKKQVTLGWGTRVCIIEGIALGLLYLHHYSRLCIIHRDLKASNILLDSELNPKISDFGMARIFGGNNSEANTKRIVGTYGYMAPEYALEGLFSIKSDVFSFGVLVLEIVSGKKNTGFYNSDSLNLIGHAWDLWISNRALELLDPSLGCPPAVAVLRCINIGLLCTQENPNDRPTTSKVVSMLGNELVALPSPKQPAFTTTRNVIGNTSSSSSSNAKNFSVNGLTISSVEPR